MDEDYSKEQAQIGRGKGELRRNPFLSRALIFLSAHRVPVLSAAFFRFLKCKIESELPHSVTLPHPLGICIGPGVRIGKNVVIWHEVTISADGPSTGAPEVDEGATIGPGAVIIGGVRIGRNARVGANAVVTEDVPAARSAQEGPC
jgi:serine O-acetyltransferase